MKNYKSKVSQSLIIFALMMATTSCLNSNPADSKEVAKDINNKKFEDKDKEIDAKFLVDAAEICMEEINLGRLAQQKLSIDCVRETGKLMESEHTKSLNELTVLAQTKMITVPTSETKDAIAANKKLNSKLGNDFGKAYIIILIREHKDAIDLFEKAATNGTDLEIKAWAKATLPALKTHLENVLQCQKVFDTMN